MVKVYKTIIVMIEKNLLTNFYFLEIKSRQLPSFITWSSNTPSCKNPQIFLQAKENVSEKDKVTTASWI